jgi:hypothetical protein
LTFFVIAEENQALSTRLRGALLERDAADRSAADLRRLIDNRSDEVQHVQATADEHQRQAIAGTIFSPFQIEL